MGQEGNLWLLEWGPPFPCQVVTSAKDAVADGVTGVVDLARRGRRWSVELTRSVSHAVDVVLGKSEELVDHFLPLSEEELGECLGDPTVHLSPVRVVQANCRDGMGSGTSLP